MKKSNLKFYYLFEKLPKDKKDLALTHPSKAFDLKIQSNQRLEFLGDSVLSLIINDYLYRNVDMQEGNLTKLKNSLVSSENLSNIAKDLQIGNDLMVGKSLKDVELSDSVLEDTLESIIGAMYLEYGLKALRPAIIELFDIKKHTRLDEIKDYKTRFQEYAQKNNQKFEYITECLGENFKSTLILDGKEITTRISSSKKKAETECAKEALKIVGCIN